MTTTTTTTINHTDPEQDPTAMTNDTVPLGLSLFRSVSRTEGLTVDVHDRRPDRDATVVRIAHHLVVGLGPQIDLDADTASALADELRRAVRAARRATKRTAEELTPVGAADELSPMGLTADEAQA